MPNGLERKHGARDEGLCWVRVGVCFGVGVPVCSRGHVFGVCLGSLLASESCRVFGLQGSHIVQEDVSGHIKIGYRFGTEHRGFQGLSANLSPQKRDLQIA